MSTSLIILVVVCIAGGAFVLYDALKDRRS